MIRGDRVFERSMLEAIWAFTCEDSRQHAVAPGLRNVIAFQAYAEFPDVWGDYFNAYTYTASTEAVPCG